MNKRELVDHSNDPEFHNGKDMRPGSLLVDKDPTVRVLDIFRVVMVLLLVVVAKDIFGFLQSLWDLILPISLYYGLMLLVLPLLRRFIDPRTCGLLWLYPLSVCVALMIILYNDGGLLIPDILIYVPPTVLYALFALWLTGAVVYLGWSAWQHFSLRTWLERDSLPAEPEVAALWERESKLAGWNWEVPVFVAPSVPSPMIIGVRKTKMVLYLPDKNYTDPELRLIFRHEVRHILRRDSETKLYWTVIRALFWFVPWVWLASHRAVEDIELSCDEFVLRNAGETTRMHYATLLLETAGDSRGFSTCLSANAGALRHRLKCVVAPPKRFSGGILLALAMILLILTCGRVSFVTQKGRVGDFYDFSGLRPSAILYQNVQQKNLTPQIVEQDRRAEDDTSDLIYEPDALLTYLQSLPITRMPDRLRWVDDLLAEGHNVTISLGSGTGAIKWCHITVSDRYFKIEYLDRSDVTKRITAIYRMDAAPDWEQILPSLNFSD